LLSSCGSPAETATPPINCVTIPVPSIARLLDLQDLADTLLRDAPLTQEALHVEAVGNRPERPAELPDPMDRSRRIGLRRPASPTRTSTEDPAGEPRCGVT
jgi:hypothetical protein